MRILVTGGAGFIGSHVCERFLDGVNEVVALDASRLRSLGWEPTVEFEKGLAATLDTYR
jgi:nucleoside-diphosphate-sugar epimerase